MSWIPYGPEGEYKIGTMGWEGLKKDPTDINTWVPTYGLWAGPEWAGGKHVRKGGNIKWAVAPCDNYSIKTSTDPEKCYSLVDAITKKHDWEYYLSEKPENAGISSTIVMNADMDMLNAIESVAQQLQASGTATFSTVKDGTIGSDGKVNLITYTGTSLDGTEITYTSLLSVAFTIKILLWDTASSVWSGAVGAFKSIWSGLGLSSTTYTDPEEPSRTVMVKEQSNGIIYEGDKGRTAVGWVLDADATKAYTTAEVTFSECGTIPDNIYEYLGNGVCRVNGSDAGDRIFASDDKENQAQLVLEGGGGKDKYYIQYGSGDDEIDDSGDNQIYYTDENGKYHNAGNFTRTHRM